MSSETMNVDELFLNKNPSVKEIYLKIIEIIGEEIGEIGIEPKKTSIHLTHRAAFGGVHPKKKWLDFNVVLDHPLEDERIVKCEQVSKNRFHNYFRLNSLDDIDDSFISFLNESYELMA